MSVIASIAYLLIGAQPAAALQTTEAAQQQPADDFAEILVTARKDASPPRLDAADYFRRLCYEPTRKTGKPAPPSDDPDWEPLDARARQQFGVTDADVPAFGLAATSQGSTLLFKAERLSKPGGLTESRCTMVVIGGDEHRRLPQQLSAVFGGSGTQRHVGRRDGSPRIAGWEQWLWSAMPAHGSRSWREVNAGTRAAGRATWLVVTDLRFYSDRDYVMGDLKIRQGHGRSLSMMTLAHITRPRSAKAVR